MTVNAKRTSERTLIEDLARLAAALGATRLSLSVSDECVAALLAAGATRSRTVIHYQEDNKPYVIEKAVLVVASTTLEACRPSRPASPGEARALDSDDVYHCLGTYKAVELNNAG